MSYTIFNNDAAYLDVNGQYHRVNNPAYTSACNLKIWAQDGVVHRYYGPAITRGIKHRDKAQLEYYILGEKIR